ncbi:hypothetical protein MBLNU459_g4194t1 [Dothideomycetes sp. NU459]
MSENYEVLPKSYGYTSTIYKLPGEPSRICKASNTECIETHFPVEKEAYERFSAHNPPSSLLKYYGVHPTITAGLVLELAEKGDLHTYLSDQRVVYGELPPSIETLYRWAEQAATALEFAHGLGVYNSDIHCLNFFLTADLNLKVGDWAGASIDGGKSHSSYRYRHRLIDADGIDIPWTEGISVKTEVFAFGSALWEMVKGEAVWPELQEPDDRDEIRSRIAGKKFPDTAHPAADKHLIDSIDFKLRGGQRMHIDIAGTFIVGEAVDFESGGSCLELISPSGI